MQKFDVEKGKYWNDFFKRNNEFYSVINEHIKGFLRNDSIGIDIGSGPGVGAKIIDNLKIKSKIYGYEPSKLYFDSLKLSLDNVKFITINKGIKGVKKQRRKLDYIFLLRSAHEIRLSLGSKKRFFEEIYRVLGFLKKGGLLLIADPCYINKPKDYLLERIKKYQLRTMHHCHKPNDYISFSEWEKRLKIMEVRKLDYIHDLKLEKSVCKNSGYRFFVSSFFKK